MASITIGIGQFRRRNHNLDVVLYRETVSVAQTWHKGNMIGVIGVLLR